MPAPGPNHDDLRRPPPLASPAGAALLRAVSSRDPGAHPLTQLPVSRGIQPFGVHHRVDKRLLVPGRRVDDAGPVTRRQTEAKPDTQIVK